MRLGGWQRVGIILSVVCALGTARYQRGLDIRRAEGAFHSTYQLCREFQDGAALRNKDSDPEQCTTKGQESWDLLLEGSWANVIFVSLAPIPLGWLAAYLLL